ncbi:MAG: DUF998 domain-containing protein [Candidatus Methanodesulfokora sp.]|nr:MAG: hypothetical protein C0200_07660 [Candidatus Korarchaeota archaeon]
MSVRSTAIASGLLASILAWVVIFLSIHYNPWFSLTKNAFSDLGGPNANMPWIFNYGLVITGIISFIFSICIVYESRCKLECVAGAFMLIASIFLMLIGIFPEGTRHHTFVSLWFFVQADMAIITWGISSIRKIEGVLSLVAGLFGPLIAVFVRWPSVATLEAFGIIIIDIWILLFIASIKK